VASRRAKPAAAASGLREAILAASGSVRRGPARWYERLPADVLADLSSVRDDWRRGAIEGSRWRLAGVISQQLTERGFRICSQLVVDRWLSRND
jgi:hypothetical protein